MRVWVTRDEPVGGPMCRALAAVSLVPVLEPVIERTIVADLGADLAALGPDDWLVLTSKFAIEAIDVPPGRPKVAVVGEESREAAERKGLCVRLVARREQLFDELRRAVERGTVFYPRSGLASCPRSWSGVTLLSPVFYETIRLSFEASVIERVDVIALASASAADAVAETYTGSQRALLAARRVASIGPSTSAAFVRHGLKIHVESGEPSFAALAAVIHGL